ncbi:MAG TPA: hypothetical protein PLU67_04015 [Candidatus Kapabacteria bacterium]|nr:hypothetical protein [Candidatus Kapabacteria bacterium]HPP39349.1 hypothetical protein [Candidatus Kapabacteria bacterium]
MKTTLLIFAATLLLSLSVSAQTKKDGTPDMRYKANKQTYGTTYSTPSYSTPSYSTPKSTTPSYSTPSYSTPKTTERNYNNGGQYKIQSGYQKSNGTYVAPHIKTTPDNNKWNNYKSK